MFALAIGSPFINVESLPSRQMVLASLLGSSWDEAKGFAGTLLSLGGLLLLADLLLMVFPIVASETARV